MPLGIAYEELLGAFHSTRQSFRKFGNSGKRQKFSWKVSRNSGNCWIFWSANHSTEIEWKENFGKLGIPREVVFFFLTSSPNLHRIFNFSFQTFRKILVITSEFVKQPVYRYLCLHEAHWSLIKKKNKNETCPYLECDVSWRLCCLSCICNP